MILCDLGIIWLALFNEGKFKELLKHYTDDMVHTNPQMEDKVRLTSREMIVDKQTLLDLWIESRNNNPGTWYEGRCITPRKGGTGVIIEFTNHVPMQPDEEGVLILIVKKNGLIKESHVY